MDLSHRCRRALLPPGGSKAARIRRAGGGSRDIGAGEGRARVSGASVPQPPSPPVRIRRPGARRRPGTERTSGSNLAARRPHVSEPDAQIGAHLLDVAVLARIARRPPAAAGPFSSAVFRAAQCPRRTMLPRPRRKTLHEVAR